MVYEPAEDSYLLAKEIEKTLSGFSEKQIEKIRFLDMGSGSGIQALTAIQNFVPRKNVLAVDVDNQAIRVLKSRKIKAIKSDLFSKLGKKQVFDMVVFNAPYLPEDKNEPKDSRLATTAGKKGYEIILKFLKQARSHLAKDGKILLLFSSLSQPEKILEYAAKLNYDFKLLIEEKLFFEKLFVYEFSNN